jgi:hypothetical protein
MKQILYGLVGARTHGVGAVTARLKYARKVFFFGRSY